MHSCGAKQRELLARFQGQEQPRLPRHNPVSVSIRVEWSQDRVFPVPHHRPNFWRVAVNGLVRFGALVEATLSHSLRGVRTYV